MVVTWRGREHIGACLDALAGQTRPHRTIVLDNASDDGTAAVVAAHPLAPEVIRLDRNAGYAGGLAAALPSVGTPYAAWLNDDAAPAPDWLAALEDALEHDDRAGAASARLSRPDGAVQSVGVRLTALGYGADAVTGPVFGFCGGAALVRMSALAEVGGVPAGFFCYYEDTDTSWRLRLGGWTVLSAPDAVAVHLHGASTRPGSRAFHRWNERNRLLMLLRCAPLSAAVRELARFAAITLALPLRRAVPAAPNFAVGLRLGVLVEVAARLPGTLRQRRAIGRRAVVDRAAVWAERGE
ncbi:Glycosyltransferase, GT2 family [Actinokineospora iranica]|uniref:Glycosyltransferase, GT2 family n=1 Tax=Actinokineospora iranica TaxID=1271860 RepID=A0A1G6SXV4_9PSEU|nr:Glycosyltransferase, GT2 family [Actinokineospora iranica]